MAKTPPKPKETPPPFLNPDAPPNDQPVAEGVLELEPLQVTKKKTIELPLQTKPVTLEKFFYDDGAIFKNKSDTLMISAGPEKTRAGLVGAIKFTIKF